jgi:hypothetical protein
VRVVKIVNTPSGIRGPKMEGCTITFPQHVHTQGFEGTHLCVEAIRAAIMNYRIHLVDDEGKQTELERRALSISDFRLRAVVLWNLMMVAGRVPDAGLEHDAYADWAAQPQTIAEFEALIADADVDALLRETIVLSHDTELEEAVRPSDVGRVRVEAAGTEASLEISDGDIHLTHVGVLPVPSQDMGAVLNGIQRTTRGAFVEEDIDTINGGNNVDDDNANDVDEEKKEDDVVKERVFELRRTKDPVNDYAQVGSGLFGGFHDLFPLQRGVYPNKTLGTNARRHLLVYGDNRISTCLPLVFHLASIAQRPATK